MATLSSNQPTSSADPQSRLNESRAAAAGATSVSQFPSELPVHYAKITFVQYDRKNPNSSPTERIVGNIVLPVPSQLNDTSTFQYAGNEAGLLGLGANVANSPGGWKGAMDDLTNSAKATWDKFNKDGLTASAESLLASAPGFQDSQLGRLIGQQTGKVLNPHLSTIFQGVALRSHQFSWRLSPRNQAETKAITAIDTMFKYHGHPKMSQNTFSLDYPNQLYISFYPESADFTYKVRKSVILGYTLNDAATGMPAWFSRTGAPTDYELTLALQEVDIVTRDELTVPS